MNNFIPGFYTSSHSHIGKNCVITPLLNPKHALYMVRFVRQGNTEVCPDNGLFVSSETNIYVLTEKELRAFANEPNYGAQLDYADRIGRNVGSIHISKGSIAGSLEATALPGLEARKRALEAIDDEWESTGGRFFSEVDFPETHRDLQSRYEANLENAVLTRYGDENGNIDLDQLYDDHVLQKSDGSLLNLLNTENEPSLQETTFMAVPFLKRQIVIEKAYTNAPVFSKTGPTGKLARALTMSTKTIMDEKRTTICQSSWTLVTGYERDFFRKFTKKETSFGFNIGIGPSMGQGPKNDINTGDPAFENGKPKELPIPGDPTKPTDPVPPKDPAEPTDPDSGDGQGSDSEGDGQGSENQLTLQRKPLISIDIDFSKKKSKLIEQSNSRLFFSLPQPIFHKIEIDH